MLASHDCVYHIHSKKPIFIHRHQLVQLPPQQLQQPRLQQAQEQLQQPQLKQPQQQLQLQQQR